MRASLHLLFILHNLVYLFHQVVLHLTVHQALPAHLDVLVPGALQDEERKEVEVHPALRESEAGGDLRDLLGLQQTVPKDIILVWVSIQGRSREIFLTLIFFWKFYHWKMMS